MSLLIQVAFSLCSLHNLMTGGARFAMTFWRLQTDVKTSFGLSQTLSRFDCDFVVTKMLKSRLFSTNQHCFKIDKRTTILGLCSRKHCFFSSVSAFQWSAKSLTSHTSRLILIHSVVSPCGSRSNNQSVRTDVMS